VLWGVFLRPTAGAHVSWLLNSVTHLWGALRMNTHNDLTNNWWVALLTSDEGWHHSHNSDPATATRGMTWQAGNAKVLRLDAGPKWITVSPGGIQLVVQHHAD